MKKQTKLRIVLFSLIMLLLFLVSCATKPAEKEVAWNYVQTNPTEFAKWCKERFPNVITKVIPGKKEMVIDTVLVKGDSIPCPTPTNPNAKIKVPDKVVTTASEKCTPDTIQIADTRDVQIANDKLKKAEENTEYWLNSYNQQVDQYNKLLKENKDLVDENSSLKVSKNTAWWITGILSGLIILFFIYRIFIRK